MIIIARILQAISYMAAGMIAMSLLSGPPATFALAISIGLLWDATINLAKEATRG